MLSIDLTKHAQNPYFDNHRILMKETKDDTIDGEIYHDLRLEESI